MEFTKELLGYLRSFFITEDEIYSDISVVVEDKIFPCHRFVLAAFSPYFRGLLRFPSDKEETKHGVIKLKDISSEAFRLIYEFLYHHVNGLNEDNFLDVWSAADFLQIDFIISACQKIASELINERNVDKYFWHVKLLDKNLMPKILDYMICNFDHFKDSECMMQLESDELLSIVRDPNLRTCREENVVDTILKWVSHITDDKCSPTDTDMVNKCVHKSESLNDQSESNSAREEFLVPLLSVCRLTSLDKDYLNNLLHHHKIVLNASAFDLITKAKMNKTYNRPFYKAMTVCHRKCSQWEDVVAMPNTSGSIALFSLTGHKQVGQLNSSGLPRGPVLTSHTGDVYACGYVDCRKDAVALFLKVDRMWHKVANLQFEDNTPPLKFRAGQITLWSLPIGDHLFVVHARRRSIFQFNPAKRTGLKKLTSVPTEMPVVHATHYESSVLVICGRPNNPAFLNVYDTKRKEWTVTVPIEGLCAQNIASFYKEDKLYFLTTDYKLYVVQPVRCGVTLKLMTSFPNINESLIGALVYCESLYLFVHDDSSRVSFQESYQNIMKFPELFSQVRVFVAKRPSTSFLTACKVKKRV